jgi:succinate dehydrogenase / fumarate reductase, membrane anchor subunit
VSTMSSMRTPLKTVRHLGSAKEGTDHFWRQRLTAVANLILAPLFVALVVSMIGADYGVVRRVLGHPIVAIAMALFIGSALVHMRIGMQVIIEDYVHGEGRKIVLLVLNTFFAIVMGVVAIYALLKLSFVEF